ncbi:MAG: hypothetical protein ACP5QA_06390 [Phycisphaerae bacterium]
MTLKEHINSVISSLHGPWVKVKSNYELELCNCLGMKHEQSRYWDASWNGCLLEFKKGKSIWLDLVRYSEVRLKQNELAMVRTETLFFLPDNNGDRIIEVACVDSAKLMEFLGLSDDSVAKSILAINDTVPRSLNAQASVTWTDVRKLQQFNIK